VVLGVDVDFVRATIEGLEDSLLESPVPHDRLPVSRRE
jgi:hypothetical protein